MGMLADDTDFDLPEAAEFLDLLLDMAGPPVLPNQDKIAYVQDLEVKLPVEMQIRSSRTNGLQLRLSPPTQTTATSVFPVLHHIRLRITAGKNG